MNNTLVLLSIASAVAIGAISPGPSFVMVARTAVVSSRTDGFFAALGMGIGAMLFALAALLGLHTLLNTIPWLYILIKLMGGAYLTYLGCKIFRNAKTPLVIPDNKQAPQTKKSLRSFWLGLGTQVSNPKTAIVYASIFVALLPRDTPTSILVALPIIVLGIETGWYAVVALVLSSSSPRVAYLHYKSWIDRTAGGVMGLLGLQLIASTKEM